MIVCDRDSKERMVHRCSQCPEIEPLKTFLTKALTRNESDDSDADSLDNSDSENVESDDLEITFNQWSSTDRAELIKQTTSLSDFIELLSEKLDKITFHSFIAKAQGSYLKQQIENLGENDVIVLVHFAENYKFLVQDEIQGYHWNKTQCTLHPVVVYSKKDGVLVKRSPVCPVWFVTRRNTSLLFSTRVHCPIIIKS